MSNTNEEKRKNVLLCTPIDDETMKHTGGIAVWAKNLKKYYEETAGTSSVSVTFFPCNRRLESYKNLTANRIVNGIREYIKIICDIQKELNSRKYNVLHLCSSASLGLFKDLIIVGMARRKRIISVVHFRFGRIPELSKQRNWEWKILTKVVRNATKIIVIDENSYQILQDCGYKNVCYIPNPLSLQTLSIIEQHKDVERQNGTIVFVGHVIPAKGVSELVKACSKISNIHVEIVGAVTDTYRTELLDMAGEGSEKWLDFVGQVPYDQVIQKMLVSGVFVLPTYTEGFPNVILESMACGCPIVTTPVGAIPEMLDIEHGDMYGICVPPRDVEALRQGILRMVSDTKYADACGKNAKRRVVEKYSMSSIWNRMVEVWNS